MNIKRDHKQSKLPITPDKSGAKVSGTNEFLWAIIGLLLTVFSTFVQAFVTNPPWHWEQQGVDFIPLGVTFQVGAVLFTGCMGGKNAGISSQLAYVFLGLFGWPIFAQGGGLDYWQEPSFGYILGFIPGAWLCGLMAFRNRTKLEHLAFSAISGLVVVHLCGLIYLLGLSYFSTNIVSANSLPSLIMNYSANPLPGQLVIVCVVAVVSFVMRKILFY
ncbi:MAG TPA: biotin transporter BioY [Cyanothece sp. UBA12306]|nr:biotin transporter BioY [Cyanothece sp. UBA12306]